MKIKKVLSYLLITIILVVTISVVIIDYNIPKEVFFLEYEFNLGNYSSFNTDTDKLYFGTINLNKFTGDSRSTRTFFYENKDQFKKKVKFYTISTEPVNEFFEFNPRSGFIIDKGAKIEIGVTFNIKKSIKPGNHNGTIMIKTFKTLSPLPPIKNDLGICYSNNLLETIECNSIKQGLDN